MKTRLFSILSTFAMTLLAIGCIEDERSDKFQIPASMCDPRPCENGGGCRSVDDASVCVCAPGFSGERCEVNEPGPCDPNPCQNAGTCVVEAGEATCVCSAGFEGPLCEAPVVDVCDPNPCQNGSCYSDGFGPYCYCHYGYTGEFCDEWEDLCSPNPCLNGGTCEQYSAYSYHCSCYPPYHGSICEECGSLCSSRVDYYRDRFTYCLGAFTGDCADPLSQTCLDRCASWMGCYGEIEINSDGYGTVFGTANAECFE